jgi:serine/threonine protein kinase
VMHHHLACDSAFRYRFEREVTAARRVHGIYTAQVLDADPAGTPPWLATAYVPGPSLREAVDQYGPMPVRTVAILATGVAEALQVIHAAGLVNRDLKPSNVLLAPDGPRVIDFGIAPGGGGDRTNRHRGPGRLPPLHGPRADSGAASVRGDRRVRARCADGLRDRRPAFGEGPELAVLYRIRHEPPDLTGCPPELRALVSRCLAKEPADRPTPAEVVAGCRGHTARLDWAYRPALAAAAAHPGAGHPLRAGTRATPCHDGARRWDPCRRET